ncbi:MAG: 30S ribosomal protein S2 [Candidatus Nomurabacteria bacterium]|nr:MAG: 30S ribosomal protein S2 [Candidatus Nomurabacteria bacterium]
MSTQTNNNSSLIDRLFKAGAHFGFKKSRRHPTSAPYLYGTKDGNDIFDLEKTAGLINQAKEIIKEAGLNGKTVLFVGTKDEAVKQVKAAALKVEMPYVVNRWIGGMLTNASETKKRVNRLEQLNRETESGELERKYTKKERLVLGREMTKLNFNFQGISTMPKTPDLMVVVDPRHDHIAVKEAIDMKVPVIGIMSSDCNIAEVNYPVLVNDALQQSVAVVLDELVSALHEGKSAYTPKTTPSRVTINRTRSPRA